MKIAEKKYVKQLKILVVDDEVANREILTEILIREGHLVETASDGQEAMQKALQVGFDLVLTDIRMPKMDGIEFFISFQRFSDSAVGKPLFVFMTAYGRVEEAVEVMRLGAMHFLTKPLKKKQILDVLEQVAVIRNRRHSAFKPSGVERGAEAVYISSAFTQVIELVDRIGPSLASVLLQGESGTGKEVLARRLHQKSARASGPFIVFHAAAQPESLIESLLFGHEKGAFTGADEAHPGLIRQAHGGTFFLDEISSMPLSVQTKLLRVIQDKKVFPLGATEPVDCDVRWVSATNVSLEEMVAKGLFREDLLFRLKVVVVDIPALRDRLEDIELLARHFTEKFCQREERAVLQIESEVMDALRAYSWPGNVRELQNVIERAVALADADCMNMSLLPPHITNADKARDIRVVVGSTLQSVEDKLIEETLRSCKGDKVQAAAILGVAPRTIYRWLERFEKIAKSPKMPS